MTRNLQMINNLAINLASLKAEFLKTYDGKSQIQEVIPIESELFPIKPHDLSLLHEFASKNSIYYNSYKKMIGNTNCMVYEGDINRYWLESISYDSSNAPFSPTWIMSAYVIALFAKELGFHEMIDVGSGDGRIAFCARILGMRSFSIEIDGTLVDLQNTLSNILDFNPLHSDATTFDYSSLTLRFPVFVIGGIAQMGGSNLATAVLEKTRHSHSKNGWVFTGTYLQKYPPDPKNEAGWGTLIENNDLKILYTISLPTCWTIRESDDTPYVFTMSK